MGAIFQMAEDRTKSSQTRNRIFTKATDLFNEMGFDHVTIRDICKGADIAIGTFYLYFKSKGDILYEVYQKADEIFAEKEISERGDLLTTAKILELIRTQFSMVSVFHIQSEGIKHLYVYQLESDNQYFFSEDRKFHTQLFKVVESGQNTGEIRSDMTCHDIAWRILRFSRGLVFDWCLHNCEYDLMDFGLHEMEIYIDLFENK
jgi:TetR/AcrR family fatty acid metabolism transcriptional regulator